MSEPTSLPAKVSKSAFGRRIAREIPVISLTDFDNVQVVKGAIRGLEAGNFDRAAQVVDAMGRDDRITGCLEKRTRALPALPLHLEPRGDGRQKKAVADEADELFEEMYPTAVLTDLLNWGLMLGVGLAQHQWEYGERRWLPRLKVWHPKSLVYRYDTQTFWVNAIEGQVEVKPGDGQWVMYLPYGPSRGWMYGKARSLYVSWLIRQWGTRDWARYSEVLGHPIKKVVTPPGAEEEDKVKFLREVAAIASEATIRTPRVAGSGAAGDIDRYDLELLEAKTNSWETFERLLDKAESCIAINLLGQNLSTEVKGGSYAATMGHLQVEEKLLRFDAEALGQCLRRQSLAWWALANFGSAELAPFPKWKTKTTSAEERVAKGNAFKSLGEGIEKLISVGVKVDIDKVIEEEDIPVTGPAEELTREDLKPPAPVAAPGAPPAPRKGLNGNTPLPRPARASQDEGIETVPPAAIEGQNFVDRLADDGTAKLQEAMAKDVQEILSIVGDAPDFDTLRKRLIAKYGEMDAERETELLHRGMLMSELAGRYATRLEAGLDEEGGGGSEEETE